MKLLILELRSYTMTQESNITTDIEDLRTLQHHLKPSSQSFIKSVLEFHQIKGYVSEKQAIYVRKYAAECRTKEAAKRDEASSSIEEIFDGKKLRAIFDRASGTLKFPKLTILDARLPGRKLTVHLATARSRTPGWIIFSNGKRPPEYVIYATINLEGTGEIRKNISPEIKVLIRRLAEETSEVAGKNGRETGVCCFCGLTLTHAISLHHGYGPICASKYNLPWVGSPEDTEGAKQKEVDLFPLDGDADSLHKLNLGDL
jgi:hypothetical protein